jgi:hypothetical protein
VANLPLPCEHNLLVPIDDQCTYIVPSRTVLSTGHVAALKTSFQIAWVKHMHKMLNMRKDVVVYDFYDDPTRRRRAK